MNGWFLTIIIFQMLTLGVHMGKHGQKRDDTYNFYWALFGGGVSLGLIYMAIVTGF